MKGVIGGGGRVTPDTALDIGPPLSSIAVTSNPTPSGVASAWPNVWIRRTHRQQVKGKQHLMHSMLINLKPDSRRLARSVRYAILAALVVVAACGEDPVAPSSCGSLPQVTVNAGETVNVTACFEDLNGDVLTYSVTTSNSSVARASASGPRITVEAVSPGNATVTVKV